MSNLEYCKIILQKVSFDPQLFRKELTKAIQSLVEIELQELKSWCLSLFGSRYDTIIEQCFTY